MNSDKHSTTSHGARAAVLPVVVAAGAGVTSASLAEAFWSEGVEAEFTRPETADELLSLLGEAGDTFRLLILGTDFPEQALELYERVRREGSGLPVILLAEDNARPALEAVEPNSLDEVIVRDAGGLWKVLLPHCAKRLVLRDRETSARQHAEEALSNIALGVSAASGQNFFRLLASYLAKALQVRTAVFCRLDGEGQNQLSVLALADRENLQPGEHLPTEGTACGAVLHKGALTVANNLTGTFPDDPWVRELKAESFVGVPLGPEGQRLGVAAIFHTRPIADGAFHASTLGIFAARADMEIEREQVRERLEGQARVLNQIGEAVISTDLEGRIKSCNRRAEEVFGLDAGISVGTSIGRLLPGGTEVFKRKMLEPLLIQGETNLEPVMRRVDGGELEVSVSLTLERTRRGDVSGVIMCCADVSAQRQVERESRDAQQRLAFHLQRTSLAYIEWDLAFRVIEWNPAAESIFGYSREEALDRSFNFLVPQSAAGYMERMFARMLEAKEGVPSMNENLTKPGGRIVCEWANTPLVNDEGTVVGFASIAQDVTERVESEKKLKQAKEAAETANRAKDEFLAVMSHEIRTPMNSIIGFTDLLLESGEGASERESLEIIKSNGYALLELINNLLYYSRLESQSLVLEEQETDLLLLLSEIEETAGAEAANKGLELTFHVDEAVPLLVVTDYIELRQLLLNLVNNAIKFTESGRVEVVLTAVPARGEGQWRYNFAIRDTGIGIAPGKLENLFKSFSQVDSSSTRRFGGTGLGLAIAKKIANLLGGDIWADSAEGRGSTFYVAVKLSVLPGESLAEGGGPADIVHPARQPLDILVCEPEAYSRRLVRALLSHLGYEARVTRSGAEAEQALREAPADFMLLSLQLPDMPAFELVKKLRAGEVGRSLTDVFIAGFSPFAMSADRQRCIAAGMDEHLAKPLVRGALAPCLAKASQRERLRR